MKNVSRCNDQWLAVLKVVIIESLSVSYHLQHSSETASEILGKHRQKKKRWITAEILDLCDKRRELRKKRFEPEESEKYKEVNNNI